ncbi:hypothetical protein QBD00_003500 [Ochrobactrum sp. AN78]|nr:hypothetical protein [Ochrobactrum sp. AN78]
MVATGKGHSGLKGVCDRQFVWVAEFDLHQPFAGGKHVGLPIVNAQSTEFSIEVSFSRWV